MPRISTDNYDTVASWNGSQDLFIVEQPDGTKVATPNMLKQFIEAGDFEATGEIKDGHGNILKDMAKTADVDAEIGDLSQTGLSGDSVAAQLLNLNGAIDSQTGGKVSRYAVSVENNKSAQITFASDYSTDAEFALVAFNIGGNSLAGFALLALGMGNAKIKDLIGSMSSQQYEATFTTSPNRWTIKNKCGSTVKMTVMLTKGYVNVI